MPNIYSYLPYQLRRALNLSAALASTALCCASCSKTSTDSSGTVQTAAAALPPKPRPVSVPTPSPARMKIAAWAHGKVLRKVPVKPGEKVFALTFDDGPWPRSTRQMLKVLKEKHVLATFFMVGQEVSRRPEVAREVAEAGMAIGNHSWDHPARPRDPVGEITRTDTAIRKAVGFSPHLFRPPYGLTKNGMAKQAAKEGDPILIWSADCADWKRPGAAHIAMMIVGQASPGGISLMHDGGGDRSQSVAALPVIIDRLRAKGYRFVTIPQLLAMRYVAPFKPKTAKTAKGAKAARSAKGAKGARPVAGAVKASAHAEAAAKHASQP